MYPVHWTSLCPNMGIGHAHLIGLITMPNVKCQYFSMKPTLFDRYHQIALFVQFIEYELSNCPHDAQKKLRMHKIGHIM